MERVPTELRGMHPINGMGVHLPPIINAVSVAGPYELQMNIMNELHALWHDIRRRTHESIESTVVSEQTDPVSPLGVWEFAQFLSTTTTSQQSCILTILECLFQG
jgi:hypothetical protein